MTDNHYRYKNSYSPVALAHRLQQRRYPILLIILGVVLLTGRGFAQDSGGTDTDGSDTVAPAASLATTPSATTVIEVASDDPTATPIMTPTVTTAEPTETSLPTAIPSLAATVTPTSQPTTVRGDRYEPDSQAAPIPYTGMQLRSFHAADDVDYVVYRLKANVRTWLRTTNLRGSADTVLTAYHLHQGHLLGSSDDDGSGFGSQLSFNLPEDVDLLIAIENKAMGYGDNVTYQFEIITEVELPATATSTTPATLYPTYTPLPTYTPFPSATPTVQPTWTPYPTYTPPAVARQIWPTPTPLPVGPWYTPTPKAWPTATPQPTRSAAVAQATATNSACFVRIEVFQDRDGDDVFEPGEGIHAVYIEAGTLLSDWTASGYTNSGVLVLDTHAAVGEEVAIRLPYLHQTAHVETVEGVVTVTISLPAPKLPIALP